MPAIGFRIARASAFALLLVFTNLTAAGIDGSPVTRVAEASNTTIDAPDQPGSFNVGVMVFSATMSGGRTTRVQVFYPTAEPVDCAMRYRIDYLAGFYELQSPLCARPNARAFPGGFPLVVHDHGGPGPGADFQRVAQIPLHETMASHGFVTAVALHSADPVVRVRDLTLVIDALLARTAASGDPLAGSIDPDRIGISGISAGAAAAIGAAGGIEASGVPADPRIKAMVVYEPGLDYPLRDARRIAIPYLIMGGSQSRYGLAIPALFAETVLALPRIYVLNPSATHLSYTTGMCAEIDQTREAALLADPALPEPLTTRIATNPAAARSVRLVEHGADPLWASRPRRRQRPQLLQPGRREFNSFTRRDATGRAHRFSAVPADRCSHAESGDPGRDSGSPDQAAYRGLLEDIPRRRPSLHAVSHGWLRSKPPSGGRSSRSNNGRISAATMRKPLYASGLEFCYSPPPPFAPGPREGWCPP